MGAMSQEIPLTFGEALRSTARTLERSRELVARGVTEAEAVELVSAAYRKISGKTLSRMDLFSRARDRFPDEAGRALQTMALKRIQGTPLQHITGTQVFLEHEYRVGPEALIPRPETEVLARLAIQELQSGAPPKLGVEIGLGSGVLSIELLARFPGLTMLATEISPDAEALALDNARRILGAESRRLRTVRPLSVSEVTEPMVAALGGETPDFMICNPPYLSRAAQEAEPEVVLYEPAAALFAPEDDLLYFYREIAEQGASFLGDSGRVFLELSAERADSIERLFSDTGWKTAIHPDLNGRPRVLIAEITKPVERKRG